jgi:hypothetical protein
MIVVGDLHVKKSEPYFSAQVKFLQWLLENYKTETIVQVGDLWDTSSPHSDVEHFLLSVFKQFKEVHLLVGNHCYSSKTGVRSKIFKHLPNVFVYEKDSEAVIDGYTCLMLPYQNNMSHYSDMKIICDFVFSHVTNEEDSFGGEFVSFTGINCKNIFNGHLHQHSTYRDGKFINTGAVLPTRNKEIQNPIYRITKENGEIKLEEIAVPEFMVIKEINYSVDPSTLNKDWLYNVVEAPSYNDVFDKFKGFYIREEGIELHRQEADQVLVDEAKEKSLKERWVSKASGDGISQEVIDCGLKYLSAIQ